MAQYRVVDPEELVECPYDSLHMVRSKRFPYHLMKCRKNYVGNDYAVCPFNARHEMPRPELRYHMANCKDKAVLEQDIRYAQECEAAEGTYFKGNTTVPSYYGGWVPPEATENWEEELPVIPRSTFASREQREDVINNVAGMTPSQKKDYYEKLKLNYERKTKGLNSSNDDSKPCDSTKTSTDGSQLRMPLHPPQVLKDVPNDKNSVLKPKQTQVFEYSLSQAGIGRGQISKDTQNKQGTENMRITKPTRIAANIFHNQQNLDTKSLQKPNGVKNTNQSENAALLYALARGRGIGRGIPVVKGGVGGLNLKSQLNLNVNNKEKQILNPYNTDCISSALQKEV